MSLTMFCLTQMGLLIPRLNAVLMQSSRYSPNVGARTSGSLRGPSLSSSWAQAAFFLDTTSLLPGSPDQNIWGGHNRHSARGDDQGL